MWIWRKKERLKCTDKIHNAVVLEKVGDGRIMLEMINERLEHWQRRNFLLKDALQRMVNVKKVCDRRRYQMIDNSMINGLFKYGKEG